MATEKTTALLEEIKSLTILEMADLVKALVFKDRRNGPGWIF